MTLTLTKKKNKVILPQEQLPKQWLNIIPYLPEKPSPLLLPNGMPAPFEVMTQIFPEECVKQAVSQEDFIPIPEELQEALILSNRPTPLVRAFELEKAIGCEGDDIKIYYKNESVSPTGSHKGNSALAQAYYAKKQGLKGLVTETGAGQWGSALSMAGSFFDLDVTVYQVRISYQQKPGRLVLMGNFGAEIIASPSNRTKSGRTYYDKDPNHTGSLGIAISEAVEASMASDELRYTLGSVVDFVVLHQTIIGQEVKLQMEMLGETPDLMIGAIGGGSNFGGFAFPYMKDKLTGKTPDMEFLGVEPSACPSLTKGTYTWDFGDSAHMAPIMKMYTLGSSFIPPPVHAGGLRYHGASPLVSMLKKHGKMDSKIYHQREVIEAGILFSKTEGILPAPETNHAICAAIDAAKSAKKNGESKKIVFNFSGHGHFDVAAYKAYMDDDLVDYELPTEEIERSLKDLPVIDESKF